MFIVALIIVPLLSECHMRYNIFPRPLLISLIFALGCNEKSLGQESGSCPNPIQSKPQMQDNIDTSPNDTSAHSVKKYDMFTEKLCMNRNMKKR